MGESKLTAPAGKSRQEKIELSIPKGFKANRKLIQVLGFSEDDEYLGILSHFYLTILEG